MTGPQPFGPAADTPRVTSIGLLLTLFLRLPPDPHTDWAIWRLCAEWTSARGDPWC